MRIDAHQHFWNYDPQEYPWIQAGWPIRRSFLPDDLEPLLGEAGLDASIAVQARQTLVETEWLLDLAARSRIIAGVVGWVDLRDRDVGRQLAKLTLNPKLVGVRHVVQDEPDDNFLLLPEFQRGIGHLEEAGLAYDLLIFPRQLPAAIELVKTFPAQRFILDHLAKPSITSGGLEPWKSHLRDLAKQPGVYAKLSGMVTEARWQNWKKEDFRPYLDAAWGCFGEERLMIGSDWPVCLNSASYRATMGIVLEFLEQFPPATREKVLGLNAARAYRLRH